MRSTFAALAFGIACLAAAPAAFGGASIPFQGRLTDNKGAGVTSAILSVRLYDTKAATAPAVTLGPFNNVEFRDGVFTLALDLTEAQLDLLFSTGKLAQLQVLATLPDGTALTLPRQELGGVPLALRVPVGAGLRFDGDGRLVIDLDDAAIPSGIARDSEIPSLTAPGAFGEGTPGTVKATELRLPDADGTIVTVKAHTATPGAYTLTLPVNDGSNGNILITDGNGNLSWAAPGGGGDMFAATYDGGGGSQAGVVDNAEKLNGRSEAFLRDASNLNAGELADARIPASIARDAEIPTALPPNGPAGGALSGSFPNPNLADNAVTNAKLADNAVSTAELADGAVTSAELAAASVTGAHVDPNSSLTVANVTASGAFRLLESGTTPIHHTAFQAADQTGPVLYTLPAAAPSLAGQVLASSTGGVMYWTSALAPGQTLVAADGTAAAPGFSFATALGTGFFRPATNELAIATGGAEHVRVQGDGDVGFGVANPQSKIDVAGSVNLSGGSHLQFANGGSNTYRYSQSSISNLGWAGGFSINGGSTSSGVKPQDISVFGISNSSAAAGDVRIVGGSATGGNNDGGHVLLLPGAASGSGLAGKVGIGTTSPTATLEVNGQVKITGGVPGSGKVLTSDGAGLASWEAAAGVAGIASTANATAISIDANEDVTVSEDLTVAGVLQAGGSGGDAYRVGNDATLADINAANTVAIRGTSDASLGSLRLGNSGGTLSGYIGRIGINTATPGETLDVAGGVRATGALSVGDASLVGSTSHGFHLVDRDNAFTEAYLHSQSMQLGLYANPQGTAQVGTLGISYPAQSAGLVTGLITPLVLGTNQIERVRITTSGDVGIGTATPTTALSIESAAANSGIDINNTAADGDPRLTFQLSGSPKFAIGVDDSDGDKFKIGAGAVDFSTRLTIDGTGYVGVGTTAPAGILDVRGGLSPNTHASHINIYAQQADDDNATGLPLDGGNIILMPGASVNGGNPGSVGIGTANPEQKLHVASNAATGTQIRIENADTGGRHWNVVSSGSGNTMGAGKFVIADATASANRLTIDTNGNVGIGTIDPQSTLDVAGGIRMGSTASCTGTNEGTQRYNSTAKKMEFCDGTSWVRPITSCRVHLDTQQVGFGGSHGAEWTAYSTQNNSQCTNYYQTGYYTPNGVWQRARVCIQCD